MGNGMFDLPEDSPLYALFQDYLVKSLSLGRKLTIQEADEFRARPDYDPIFDETMAVVDRLMECYARGRREHGYVGQGTLEEQRRMLAFGLEDMIDSGTSGKLNEENAVRVVNFLRQLYNVEG